MEEDMHNALYAYANNFPAILFDYLGLQSCQLDENIKKNNETIDNIREDTPYVLRKIGDFTGFWDALKDFNSNPNNHTNCPKEKTEIILQNSDLIKDVISNEIYLDALVVSISSGKAIPNPRCAVKQTKQCALKFSYRIRRILVGKRKFGDIFKGRTPEEIEKMFKKKHFTPKGIEPAGDKGAYKNEKTGYSYHIDKDHVDKKGRPNPHVDVNRPKKSKFPKRKFYL